MKSRFMRVSGILNSFSLFHNIRREIRCGKNYFYDPLGGIAFSLSSCQVIINSQHRQSESLKQNAGTHIPSPYIMKEFSVCRFLSKLYGL